MQEFVNFIYSHYKESPSVVIQKALSLHYSYKELFFIVFYYQKATLDPFLDEKLFMSEINTISLECLFSELLIVKESLNTQDSQALLSEMFPS